jgi:hypothetical protein
LKQAQTEGKGEIIPKSQDLEVDQEKPWIRRCKRLGSCCLSNACIATTCVIACIIMLGSMIGILVLRGYMQRRGLLPI